MAPTSNTALDRQGAKDAAAGKGDRLVTLNRGTDGHDLVVRTRRLDLSLLPEGMLADLHAYWRSKLSSEGLPGRTEIDPLDFPWALGRVSLLEVSRKPLVFRHRIDGSLLAAHRGQDMTGHTTDEIRPLGLANVLRAHYSHVVRTAAPDLFEVQCTRNIIKTSFTTLALPLATDGHQVDMILSCALDTEGLATLFS